MQAPVNHINRIYSKTYQHHTSFVDYCYCVTNVQCKSSFYQWHILFSIIQKIYHFLLSDLDDVVQVLLDNGADVSATGNVHLFFWMGYQNEGHFLRLIRNVESSKGGFGAGDGILPLIAVVTSALVTTGADEKENLNILRKLLSAGVDVNQKTAIGQTVLHVISTTSYPDNFCGDFSLDQKEDFSNPVETEAMKILIDHGADVNICDDFGKSPLHYAAHFGQKCLVQLLLKSGADVYLQDKMGLTALEYAAMQDHLLTAALIDKYNYPVHQIIQAYECVAMSAPSPLEFLDKATAMRDEHNVPKCVEPPLECYGFLKEWETIEELEACRNNEIKLNLMCLLARERIHKKNHIDLTPGMFLSGKTITKNHIDLMPNIFLTGTTITENHIDLHLACFLQVRQQQITTLT